MCEAVLGNQHARARLEGRRLGQDAEPGAGRLRRDVRHIALRADVDLALELSGDRRLVAGDLLKRHMQPLLGEKPFLLRDVQAGEVSRRRGGDGDVPATRVE
jgi:hypothetical protein